ncbi:unnamed protein product [Rhodiola kirilowii]
MAPPETRANTNHTAEIAAIVQSQTLITNTLTEMSTRTQAVESMVQSQALVNERTNASLESMVQSQAFINERTNARLDRIFEALDRLQLQDDRRPDRRTEKQPMQSLQTTATGDSPGLLPTPTTPPLQQMITNSPHQSGQELQVVTTPRLPRIDIPTFHGDQVVGWTFQMEQYFEHQGIPPEQKLTVAMFHISGEALEWYQWMHSTHQLTDWKTFIRDLNKRFGPSPYSNAELELSQLRQTGSVKTYVAAFESLSTRTPGFSAANLLNIFMGGLRPEVLQEMILLEPNSLRRAMDMAKVVEQKIISYRSWGGRTGPPRFPLTQGDNTPPANKGHATQGYNNLPTKRLTPAQMAARREQGLCYNCDDQFVPGHRCKPKFQCLLMQTEGEECLEMICAPEPEHVEELQTLTTTEVLQETNNTPTISYHAMQGQFIPSTLRIEGTIQGKTVVVLIDSGSTHNFLQTRVAKHLNMSVEQSRYMNVTVGNGENLQCEGWCPQTQLHLGGRGYLVDLHIIPIYGADVVLGAQWLAEVGPTLFDYKQMWMSFDHQGEKVVLKGMKQQAELAQISMGQLRRCSQVDGVASLYHLTMAVRNEKAEKLTVPRLSEDVEPELAAALHEVLDQHAHVFDVPVGLPPQRRSDHHIPLLPGTGPVNVRPYRYPHFQKGEIEKLIAQMLAEGVIRPSTSPFSSPVLLVKKKDGSWRFCVDYRALNAITVRDRFPIPTVDELLDELRGASVFSKLDLRSGYHQLRMAEQDVHKTAFRTHDGHYEFLVMPFGLTNAPASFQAEMNDLFRPLLRKSVLVFFDDILVYSATWEEHIRHLSEVLYTLSLNTFYAKGSKCDIARRSIAYLGHIITREGVKVDPDKVEAIQAWPLPTNPKQLRGFLGLTGYYRRFVTRYADIAAPLTRLIWKDSFVWSGDATEAFHRLRTALMTTPTLALPDFSKQFVVQTDASGVGVAAVLS